MKAATFKVDSTKTEIEMENSHNEGECFEKDNFAKSVATCMQYPPLQIFVLLVKGTSRCQISCFGNDMPIVSISNRNKDTSSIWVCWK